MQISSEDVEFQGMSIEQLQLAERQKLYPPRFVITVTESSAAEDSLVVFTFEGATQEIVKKISLTKGIVYIHEIKAANQTVILYTPVLEN